MSGKRMIAVAAILLLLSMAIAAGAAGTKSDPVITLSYINDSFIPSILSPAGVKIDEAFRQAVEKPRADLDALQKGYLDYISMETVKQAAAKKAADALPRGTGYAAANNFINITLNKGDIITGLTGTLFVPRSGSAMVSGKTGGRLINLSSGSETQNYIPTAVNNEYLTEDDGTGIRATADGVVISVRGRYLVKRYSEQYKDLADALNKMGMFRGGTDGYDLSRPPTRLEALIMLIRLVGEENAALAYGTTHPFTDLPKWANDEADKYVAYAYDKGYTRGVSANKFDPNAIVLPEQYLTFVLRALGYTDKDDGTGDFKWRESLTKATDISLLHESEAGEIETIFLRDQVVYISYYALTCAPKDKAGTLLDTLIEKGALTLQTANSAMAGVYRVRPAR